MTDDNPSMLHVYSIFRSIDGEANGYNGVGQPSTFIRLRGCNLQCFYCDTKYASFGNNTGALGALTIEDILGRVVSFPGHKITLTGGEPLTQLPETLELISALLECGYSITVETNGSIPIRRYGLKNLPRVVTRSSTGVVEYGSVRFVVDYKLPSGGTKGPINHGFNTLWHDLTSYDVVKFVIADDTDFDTALKVIHDNAFCKAQMVFSPAIDLTLDNPMEWQAELATKLFNCRYLPAKINYSLQIHKVLWPNATTER